MFSGVARATMRDAAQGTDAPTFLFHLTLEIAFKYYFEERDLDWDDGGFDLAYYNGIEMKPDPRAPWTTVQKAWLDANVEKSFNDTSQNGFFGGGRRGSDPFSFWSW